MSAVAIGSPGPEEIERTEILVPGPADALAGLIGVAPPRGALPMMWHWVYLLDRPAQSDLGPDGHPLRGVLPAPPGPGRRRMWAGGRVQTLVPPRLGEPATRRTRVVDTKEKHGRSGRLTFVSVEHEISQDGTLCVRERQDVVYRELTGSPPIAHIGDGPPVGEQEWSLEITPPLLFRFSALTYNAHRIHYDRDYATQVEGYPGLLTHGPLQALMMSESLRRSGIDTSRNLVCDYRLVAPLFDFQGLIAGPGAQESTWQVRDRHGRVTATASFTVGV